MRTFRLHSLTAGIALGLCLLISTPVDAQSHRRGSNNTVQNRDNKSNNRKSQADNNSGRRPGVSSTGNRNNKDNNPGKKKEQPGNNNSRPENKPSNGNSNVRPQPKPQPRPGNHNNHYDNRPKWNGHIAPPARPYRPKYRPMPHIAPPPYWRPHHNAPIINGVLGLTFGTLYHATLDYLYSHDYIVDGYTNNILYLRDVAQFNYHWQDVMLNYNNGRLANAQFVYSSSYYDTGRYNNVYRILCNTYGTPISTRTFDNGAHECIWYGGNSKGMVSLEFYRHNGRYYTTLSFGS